MIGGIPWISPPTASHKQECLFEKLSAITVYHAHVHPSIHLQWLAFCQSKDMAVANVELKIWTPQGSTQMVMCNGHIWHQLCVEY